MTDPLYMYIFCFQKVLLGGKFFYGVLCYVNCFFKKFSNFHMVRHKKGIWLLLHKINWKDNEINQK